MMAKISVAERAVCLNLDATTARMINSPFVPETSLWASQQIIVVVDNNGLFGGTPFRPVKNDTEVSRGYS
jgi:hypothetical protein